MTCHYLGKSKIKQPPHRKKSELRETSPLFFGSSPTGCAIQQVFPELTVTSDGTTLCAGEGTRIYPQEADFANDNPAMMVRKCILNSEKGHLILNKYGYVFTWICLKDSLRLFMVAYIE